MQFFGHGFGDDETVAVVVGLEDRGREDVAATVTLAAFAIQLDSHHYALNSSLRFPPMILAASASLRLSGRSFANSTGLARPSGCG